MVARRVAGAPRSWRRAGDFMACLLLRRSARSRPNEETEVSMADAPVGECLLWQTNVQAQAQQERTCNLFLLFAFR